MSQEKEEECKKPELTISRAPQTCWGPPCCYNTASRCCGDKHAICGAFAGVGTFDQPALVSLLEPKSAHVAWWIFQEPSERAGHTYLEWRLRDYLRDHSQQRQQCSQPPIVVCRQSLAWRVLLASCLCPPSLLLYQSSAILYPVQGQQPRGSGEPARQAFLMRRSVLESRTNRTQ